MSHQFPNKDVKARTSVIKTIIICIYYLVSIDIVEVNVVPVYCTSTMYALHLTKTVPFSIRGICARGKVWCVIKVQIMNIKEKLMDLNHSFIESSISIVIRKKEIRKIQ